MSEELIRKCTSEAIKALAPLLDNEETQGVGIILLKSLDIGLITLSNEDPKSQAQQQSQVQQQRVGGNVQAPQNFQRDIEQENKVQGLVDDTLKELEMMDNHESNPVTTDKDGNEIEYVKGMLCNCQFASEFHKYCDNQCKETLIKAEGNPKEYIKFIDKEREDQDSKSLDEAMDDVTDFIDKELGIGVSRKPQQQHTTANNITTTTPVPQEPLDPERQSFALDPDQPVIMPGEDSGVQESSNCDDEKKDDTFVPTKAAREGDVGPV